MNATKLLWSVRPVLSGAVLTLALASPAEAQTKKGDTKSEPSSASTSSDAASDTQAEPKTDAKSPAGTEPPREEWDIKDVDEREGKTYLFIGMRYRGALIPKFMLNMFVDEGKSVYTNTVGLELDIRKDGFSLIPALSYAELGTGDILFKEKGAKETIAGNYNLGPARRSEPSERSRQSAAPPPRSDLQETPFPTHAGQE
jgi:hypothetical protein